MNISISSELMGAPPEIPREALIMQKQAEAVLIWTIGAFCILGWEFIVCLSDEYRLIWRKPMNLSSLLYLCNRYFGLVGFSLVASLATDVWSSSACKRIFFFEPISGLISTLISQMILGCRVYAIFGKNKGIAIMLLISLVAEVVCSGIAISHIVPAPRVPGPPSAQPPCGALNGPFEGLLVFWAMPLFFDTMAFLLTAWKAFDYWRKDVDTQLFEIIWRDGILYFLAILSMNVANVIIFITAPRFIRAVNIGPTLMFQVVISCRLVLNLKGSGSTGSSTPQHKFQVISNDNSTLVKINVSKSSSNSNIYNVNFHLDQPASKIKVLKKARTKDFDVKNWSLPAQLWNSTSTGNMV